MDRRIKNALILSGVGFVLGILIGVMISFFDGSLSQGITGRDVLLLFVGGVQGAIPMGLTVVYDIEDWSILRSTVTHFIPTMIVFYACSFYMGWLKFGTVGFVITTVCMIAAYYIIWMTQYLIYLKKVKTMNAKIREFRKKK
ncbi:MAG: DUF3021 domain-containing protein [Lachnospiraceae bacterium]|nr:DUF3021 domain-containing protein [Lachnospiraceae bacterium]